jgi:transcriptional regulator with XRE-family HTH domain
MNELAECFGTNLARHRRLSGLSQEDVAIRAGTHRTEVSQLERGLRLPRLDTAVRLAAAVEANLGELVEGMTWISGSYHPGSFVQSSQGQLPATRSSTS